VTCVTSGKWLPSKSYKISLWEEGLGARIYASRAGARLHTACTRSSEHFTYSNAGYCCFIWASYRLFKRAVVLSTAASRSVAMELGLESNVRHAIQRQMQLIQLCDQECDASLSRTDASIEQAILLLQNQRAELLTAIRSCYSQAKSYHSDLHSRAVAILDQLHSQPMQSHSLSDTTANAGAKLLKVLDDAQAAPLCVGCGGSAVSVDLSNVTNAISELQVRCIRAFV
jgi:hypothetical protein